MSSKEMQQNTEPEEQAAPETPAETPAESSPGTEAARTVSAEELAALKKQLADLQAQAAEYKDGWQRAVADFQNYKRRTEAEKADTYQNALGSIIKRYLPILDDLERALQSRPAGLAWAEGIELIHRKLQGILEAEGVKRIEAEGRVFDPNLHEAILQEPAEGHASGEVIAVVQNGYMLGERVIRPAQVRVAQ
jgi:molecular chaperone GrpE